MEIVINRFDRFQSITEKVLRIWAFCIAAYHMLLATFSYIVDPSDFTPYVQWASLGLLIAALLYLVFTLLYSETSRKRTTAYLKRFCNIEQIVLLLLLLWTVLSCLINQANGIFRYFFVEDWHLYDAVVCILVLFPLSRAIGKEKTKKVVEILIHLCVVTYSVFTIVSLWHIFHLEVLTFPSGNQAGVTAEVQVMLGRHPNLTGMIAVTMLVLCTYMVYSQEREIRALYIFFGVVHLVIVYLCNSRAILVGTLVFVVYEAFFFTFNALKEKKLHVKLGAGIAVCLVCGFLFWEGRYAAFAIFENITHISEEIEAEQGNIVNNIRLFTATNLSSHLKNYEVNALSVPQNYGMRALTNLSGRPEIWMSTLKVMTSSIRTWFFGVTSYSATLALQTIGGLEGEAAHAHNIFLQLGLSLGTPAMILFIAFVVLIAFRCARVVINGDEKGFIISGMLLCFIFVNLMEPYLFNYFSIMSCVFFLFSGYILERDKTEEEKIEDSKKKKFTIFSVSAAVYIPLVFLVFILMFSARYVNLIPEHFKGTGTVEDPFQINNRSDLKYFRDLVNSGNNLKGYYFLQTTDIDLKNKQWMPIGIYNSGKYFAGIYDGGCHCIKNLYISSDKYPYYPTFGFFGSLEGVVVNLGIASGSVNGACVGAIASQAVGRQAMIINCYNCAEITGTGRAGGICDNFGSGYIINCLNTGKIDSPTPADIVSYTAGFVTAPEEKGNITVYFTGRFVPIEMEGETIEERLNSGLEELIEKGAVKKEMVKFW